MLTIFKIILLLLDVAFFILLVHVIMSWLINFQVLNLRQPLVAQIWDGLNRLLEPIYGPIRRIEVAPGHSVEWWFLPIRTGKFDDVMSKRSQAEAGMRATIEVK